jgi:hypothetical protein
LRVINAHDRHNVKPHRPVPHAEVSKLFPISVPEQALVPALS